MASNFTLLSQKFYDQIINGSNFSDNLGSFNTILTGNVGDKIQSVQRISLFVDYSVSSAKTVQFKKMTYDPDYSSFLWVNDAYLEGFYPGGVMKVTRGSNSANVTILGITGVGNKTILISKADGIAIDATVAPFDATYTDLEFRLTTQPTFVRYRYGINKSTDITPLYQSHFDSNGLIYQLGSIPTHPTFASMNFLGGQEGANMGNVAIAFVTTLEAYRFVFEVKHTFKINFYKFGELTNLETAVPTPSLFAGSTYKFDTKFEVGTPVHFNSIFVNTAFTGNVGYFNENYNGGVNNYTITDVSISNASGTGVLEATEVNTITFKVNSLTIDFVSGIKGIAGVSKLPTPIEYQNKTTFFDTIWIWENLRNAEGAGAVNGTIIKAFEFEINSDPKILDVTFTYELDSDQQELISDSDYLLWFTIANNNLTSPSLIDRVNLILDVNKYTKNTDVSGLITNHQIDFFPSWNSFNGQTGYSDFTGGDGDLWGARTTFKLNTVNRSRIVSCNFKVISTDGTDEILLINKPFILGLPTETTDGTYFYQLLNIDYPSDLNLPLTDIINRIYGRIALPVSLPSTTQDVELRCGFQITWRDWIENLSVPISFYDIAELNNNRNYKTSNYAGVLSFNVYGVFDLGVKSSVNDETTIYRIKSDPSTILDFDVAGWTGLDGVTKFYNLLGEEVTDVVDGEDTMIKIDFEHSLGTLALNKLVGEVWAENDLSTAKPSYLATYRDWTSETNFLKPTDTLLTGNYRYVEVVSISNKVTFICQTNHLNVVSGYSKNVYGRLWKKP